LKQRISFVSVILFSIIFYAGSERAPDACSPSWREDETLGLSGNFPGDTAQALPRGEIIRSVKCMREPDQSYALYLPSQYNPGKQWPVVYAFDPAARGVVPLELMKEAAERYGYIVAASNNSRNGPWQPSANAAQAVWEDTHRRLSIDDSCVYFAGFSGGARVAAILAQRCKCAQGVLLNGAGFSPASPPSSADRFSVFAIVGLTDFNYDEMVRLDQTLETLDIPHFLRRFDGSHQWGPEDIWQVSFAWMRLLAMKNGPRPRDEQFIADELAAAMQRAQALEDSGEVYFAWQDYREISNLFQGLANTKKIDGRIAAIEKTGAAKEGMENEEEEINEQVKLQNDVLNIVDRLCRPNPRGQVNDDDRELQIEAGNAVRRFRNDVGAESHPGRRRAFERARSNVFAYLMETGRSEMDANRLETAKRCFELAIETRPDAYGPHLSLARCLIRTGDREESIEELGRARKLGLSAQALADLSRQGSDLTPLIDDPEFKKLTTGGPVEH
jgi:tetratricopeptide (TPR) repeat protein